MIRAYDLALAEPLETGRGLLTSFTGALHEHPDGGLGDHPGLEAVQGFGQELRNFAQETAELDASARGAGEPLYKLISRRFLGDGVGPRPGARVLVHLTTSLSQALAASGMAYLRGIGTLKIKVPQTETWTSVRRQLEELRLVQPTMNIRLDFAGGWENDLRRGVDLRPRLHDLADLAIEYVEDPVLPQSLAQVPRDILPIAADVVDLAPGEANRLVSSLGVRTLVVKPQLFGTWGAAINLIQMAQSKGIQVVLSSLYDGPVGIAALLHLAVALGLTESAQGLNTLALCTPHPCRVLKPGRDGRIAVPEGAGLGLDRPWAP
tara:strand:- start:247 stop:1209 length:963 start_codon:yes stop_codon:yes gene_type:complete